jgi:digeranylgeranylglycerophospholipid reductase
MEEVEFLVVGCGPAGGTAAREAARSGVETLVLERDPVVGAKRVCAAGLRPGFCADFDLPASIIHCNPTVLAAFGLSGRRYDFPIGTGHTTTREELDGTIAELARAEGATIRTRSLFRSIERAGERTIVEYADLASGERKKIRARAVFLAPGSSVRIGEGEPLGYREWKDGLITCLQYRVYLERPAAPAAYEALEMYYYRSPFGRNIIGWTFPKRDHLSIGLGVGPKVDGKELRTELDGLLARVQARLFPGIAYTLREEGNLLYGGKPRPKIADGGVMIGGTAAGLVDATTGEGIHEAASSGRFAAQAMAAVRRGKSRDPGAAYEGQTKAAFYGRLLHRYKLISVLEKRPRLYDVLFEQIARERKLCDLLQRDRNDFTLSEWLYLYLQAALFGAKSLRA